ncbi:MAG: T9SS type A sorting domain-containing protein [Ferruginibacter sp.]
MVFLIKNIIFTKLKTFITIFILVFGLNFTSFAQETVSNRLAAEKIVKFYPNPATTVVNFEFNQGYDKSFTLQLYNFIGKKVFEITPASNRYTLSLNGYFRGVYIYQLRNKFGKIVDSGKIQVVR